MIHLTSELDTPFHRELATAEWLRSCAATLETRIRSLPVFQSADGEGRVRHQCEARSEPDQVAKYEFCVEVDVARRDLPGQTDLYAADIGYEPETNTFRIREEGLLPLEKRQAQEEMHRLTDRMLAGDLPLLKEFPCVICGGRTRLFLKESDQWPEFMNIFGGVHCEGCGFGRELCGLSPEPHLLEFVIALRSGRETSP